VGWVLGREDDGPTGVTISGPMEANSGIRGPCPCSREGARGDDRQTDRHGHTICPLYNDGHLAAAHPDAERQFQVLSTPDAESLVERSDLHEVIFIDSDGAADQRGAEVWLARLNASLLLVVRQLQPRVTVQQQSSANVRPI